MRAGLRPRAGDERRIVVEWLRGAREHAAAAWGEWLSALYPALCAVCGEPAIDGAGCVLHALPLGPPGPRCPRCAAPLPPALANAERCAECRRRSFGLERVLVLGDYRSQPELREWILAFKHGGRRELAGPLGAALARCVEPNLERMGGAHVFVPVPLHPWRRLERGYDQAALLAQACAQAAERRVVRALRRARPTVVQGAAGAVSRSANVRGAFHPARPAWLAARALARADWVWIVDDVVTSGATLRECARALRRLGARRVGGLALARAAPRPSAEPESSRPHEEEGVPDG